MGIFELEKRAILAKKWLISSKKLPKIVNKIITHLPQSSIIFTVKHTVFEQFLMFLINFCLAPAGKRHLKKYAKNSLKLFAVEKGQFLFKKVHNFLVKLLTKILP